MKHNLNPAVIALIYSLASYIITYASIMFSVYRLKKELINESILFFRMPSFVISFLIPYVLVYTLFNFTVPDLYKLSRYVFPISTNIIVWTIFILSIFSIFMVLWWGFAKVMITDKKIIISMAWSFMLYRKRIVYFSEIKNILSNPVNGNAIIVLNDDSNINIAVSYKRIKKIEKLKDLSNLGS